MMASKGGKSRKNNNYLCSVEANLIEKRNIWKVAKKGKIISIVVCCCLPYNVFTCNSDFLLFFQFWQTFSLLLNITYLNILYNFFVPFIWYWCFLLFHTMFLLQPLLHVYIKDINAACATKTFCSKSLMC